MVRFEDLPTPLDPMNPARPLDSCGAATSLSRPSHQPARLGARRAAWARLAQSSLYLLALTMASSGCLVTSTPEFTPPERTRPFLIPASADPDPRGVLLIDTLEQQKESRIFEFSADVVSEDQGDKVKGSLYIDYGQMLGGHPYAAVITQIRELPPSTMADTAKRNIRGKLDLRTTVLNPGCHTVTLIVSHEFDAETSCPVCRNDSSQLTWQVFRCNPEKAASECQPDFSLCEKWGPGCGATANAESGIECGAMP